MLRLSSKRSMSFTESSMQSVPLVTAELLHARPDAIALSPEIPEPSARSFSGKWASLLKLLVEKGKATDHGAALVSWAGSTFARHNPTGPMEETSMS
jgi:hypothetical protein